MTLSAQALLHQRPGRPRLPRARRQDGKSDGERPADIVSIAKAYRIKAGAIPEIALDANYGSTIGQLRLEGSISGEQLITAERYARIVIQNARLYGIPSPHPRAHDHLQGIGGLSCGADIPEDEANEIKGRFRDCRRALLDCGRDLLVGSAVNRVVYGVVVENWDRASLQSEDVQNLRCGLNALERVLR